MNNLQFGSILVALSLAASTLAASATPVRPVHPQPVRPVHPQASTNVPTRPNNIPSAVPNAPNRPSTPTSPVPASVPTPKPTVPVASSVTTLAGDLGLKYNLGRDVSATAKYGTDNRYGLNINAQVTPSFGLDAEAYRKDGDNAIRFGLVYTINPSAPVDVPPATTTIQYVDRVVTVVKEKVVIKYYPKAKRNVRGRG
jgi:hypothetical protein